MSLLGVLVGTLTGVIGIGGGFLIVPALVLLARLPMRQAVGTSLTVIAMTTAAAYAGQSGRGEIPWEFVILFGGTVTAGIIAGTRAVRYVGQRSLKRAFAVLLLVTAGAVLWRSGSFF